MDNETLRQKEIERLNLIINLLIEKNHELELKLRSLSPEYISSKQPVLLNHEDLSDVNGLHYSTLLQNEQVNGVIYNDAEKTNAQNSAAYSNVEERRQPNEPVYSNVKELQQSNHVTNPPLPQQIDVNKVKMPDVYRALHKRMPHAKRTAAHHTAVMLVHLYKKQENTHQETY